MGVLDGRRMSDNELYDIAGGRAVNANSSSMLYEVVLKCPDCGDEFKTYGNVPNLMPGSYEWFCWNHNHNRCEKCRKENPFPSKDEWIKGNHFIKLSN